MCKWNSLKMRLKSPQIHSQMINIKYQQTKFANE